MKNNLCDTLKIEIKQRLKIGESINSIAKSADLSHAQVCRFLSGERQLNSNAIARLVDALGFELCKR